MSGNLRDELIGDCTPSAAVKRGRSVWPGVSDGLRRSRQLFDTGLDAAERGSDAIRPPDNPSGHQTAKMTREQQLLPFIEASKQHGASDEFVFSLLRANGWSSDVIHAAFGRYYETLTGLPVPVRQGIVEGARDAFLQLLSFGTLSTWTIALGALLFAFINRQFPDAVTAVQWGSERYGIASNLASLMVAFPVYLFVMRFMLRDYQRYPEKRNSGIRRWLTWLALLIAAAVIIGDVITFLRYFLQGEITARFVFKVITVLLIASGVFSYYIASLQGQEEAPLA